MKRLVRVTGLLAVLGMFAGCGPGIGDVSGKVTYQGKPVVCGSVILVGPDGMTKAGNIGADGSFTVKGVGAGTVQAAVVSLDPARPLDPHKAMRTHGKDVAEPTEDSGRNPDAGRVIKNPPNDKSNWADPTVDRSKWFPLPAKYELVHSSGLAVQIKAGTNDGVDLELK